MKKPGIAIAWMVISMCQRNVVMSDFTRQSLEIIEEERELRRKGLWDSLPIVQHNESLSQTSLREECNRLQRNFANRQAGDVKDRSLSPWKLFKNFDSRRANGFEYIVDAACICRGCFYKNGGRYLYDEAIMISRPFKVQYAYMTGNSLEEPKYITVTKGCYCETSW